MVSNDYIPFENIEIFKLFYKIETGLREYVIELLSDHYGPKWYKSLPPDIKQKMINGKDYEKKISWINFIPFHPIYFVDFTDLVKIIGQGDKWRDVFSHVFTRKEIISSTLKELEPIRNKIAHNRKASNEDLVIVQSAMNKLNSWITPEIFEDASKRCTRAISIKDTFSIIGSHIDRIYSQIISYETLEDIDWWRSLSSEWWFDDEYIGVTLKPVETFMEKAAIYAKLSRDRGCGHNIETWVKDNSITDVFNDAGTLIRHLMEED